MHAMQRSRLDDAMHRPAHGRGMQDRRGNEQPAQGGQRGMGWQMKTDDARRKFKTDHPRLIP